MTWQSHLNGDPLPWLLEPADPGALPDPVRPARFTAG
jgi:hypothetical protein